MENTTKEKELSGKKRRRLHKTLRIIENRSMHRRSAGKVIVLKDGTKYERQIDGSLKRIN